MSAAPILGSSEVLEGAIRVAARKPGTTRVSYKGGPEPTGCTNSSRGFEDGRIVVANGEIRHTMRLRLAPNGGVQASLRRRLIVSHCPASGIRIKLTASVLGYFRQEGNRTTSFLNFATSSRRSRQPRDACNTNITSCTITSGEMHTSKTRRSMYTSCCCRDQDPYFPT